jgi:hypothetical protein
VRAHREIGELPVNGQSTGVIAAEIIPQNLAAHEIGTALRVQKSFDLLTHHLALQTFSLGNPITTRNARYVTKVYFILLLVAVGLAIGNPLQCLWQRLGLVEAAFYTFLKMLK